MSRNIHSAGWRKKIGNLLHRYFPERQLILRTGGHVSYLRFSRHPQIALSALLVLLSAWAIFATTSYVLHDRVIAGKDNQIADARFAYRNLLGEIAEYQKKFTAITANLENNHVLMLRLVEQNAALQQNLKTVKARLESTEQERQQVVATRENLRGELASLQQNMQSVSSDNSMLKDDLGTLETDLQTALAERNQSLFRSTQMRRHVKELETRLASLQESEMDTVQGLTGEVLSHIDDMQKVVKKTGLQVSRLVSAEKKISKGQGGPFIEASPDNLPANHLKVGLVKLETHLQYSSSLLAVMRRLPLSPPLNTYYISSTYGKRRDPINKKWASHYGVDFGSAFKSPVYVTSPGVVTHVGWKGNYGKLVEVDHGSGLKTRYGHLQKTLVKKGQKVKFHERIGLLGNTGRSTGAHLHYEVIFKGKARNPMKFIKAGRYVFQD